MKLFDENGNYLGEFIEETKEKVEDAFDDSWIWGVVFFLLIAPGWTILGIVLILLFKITCIIIKLVWGLTFWFAKLPFCLFFKHTLPRF